MYFKQKPDQDADHSPSPYVASGHSGYKSPLSDNTTYMLIILVVLIPVIFTIVVCAVTYCIYRFNKSRNSRLPTDTPIASFRRSGAPLATIIYNTQHSPFIFEESPPSYDSLGDIKKDPLGTTNTNEQLQLTTLPNNTLTNTNEEVTAAASIILPTAPDPPLPPFYINLGESNK